jgi:hypothetical protein
MRAIEADLDTDEDRAELARLVRRVKPRAEVKRRETDDIVRGVAAMIRSLGARVGDGDETDLAELNALHAELDAAIVDAVRLQRTQLDRGVSSSNASWQHIANAFGTTRSAAFQRFGDKIEASS